MNDHISTIGFLERIIGTIILASILVFLYIIPQDVLSLNVCIFKITTGHACPLCGITESLHHLLRGNISASIQKHPLGIPLLKIAIVCIINIIRGQINEIFLKAIGIFFIFAFLAIWMIRIATI